MNKKIFLFVILSSLIVGGLGGWLFNRYLMPKVSTWPFLAKYNLAPQYGVPLIINRREEIRVNEGSDSIAVIQRVKPWLVSVLTGNDIATTQVVGGGVILTSDGIIAIPRSLLIAKTQIFKVATYDGNILNASFLSEDPSSDIVLIKAIQSSNLPTANLGYAKDLQLGQRMIVLFPTINEFHVNNQVSFLAADFKSYLEKTYSSDKLSQSFKIDDLQNLSEGSMAISLDGNVQGLYSKSKIVPADVIRDFLNRYFNERTASVKRAYIGLSYEPISKTLSNLYGVSEGVLIKKVEPKSPAFEAGLKEGDIITKINDNSINLDNSFEDFIRSNPAEFAAKLNISRATSNIELTLKSSVKVSQ